MRLSELEQVGLQYTILFLEASDEVLVRRFKETRRRHPLMPEGSILEAIARGASPTAGTARTGSPGAGHERDDAARAARDASAGCSPTTAVTGMAVTVMSFGFKHGVPIDADLVLDVRFLPNPFWVEDLAPQTGKRSGRRGICFQVADGKAVHRENQRLSRLFVDAVRARSAQPRLDRHRLYGRPSPLGGHRSPHRRFLARSWLAGQRATPRLKRVTSPRRE